MTRVVVSPKNVVDFPDGGGHFWVYLQYVDALRRLGCEVFWLEEHIPAADPAVNEQALTTFRGRLREFGLEDSAVVYTRPGRDERLEYLLRPEDDPEAIFRGADLLLNFHYAIEPALLARFRRTALVDVDPGLLQLWLAHGQLDVPRHDVYFTIGPTVGTADAAFPDAGLPWRRIRPPVSLALWHPNGGGGEAYTTVSSWWGDEWVTDGRTTYENNKRVSFLELLPLPQRVEAPLELAIYSGPGDEADLEALAAHGWRVRHSLEVARTPSDYAAYIRGSRGEFSCAKPSCLRLRNAWVSDRSLCYLAAGKPVVVQDTGQGSFLPAGEGMFFFSSLEAAAEALAAVERDYPRQCALARELAETYFDGERVLADVLDQAAA